MQNNVQELRLNKNITQEDLAGLLDVTRQTIISIEKGNYIPSLLLAMKIAKVFKLKVEDIFWQK
jgi:putative transcriptional regulator